MQNKPSHHTIALALYQPDIPQNAGAMLRLAACLGIGAHIIGPAGFRTDERALRRAGMDYLAHVALTRHVSWAEFVAWRRAEGRRLVLATTKASQAYTAHRFLSRDIILMGRESEGVPNDVHESCEVRITVPMAPGMRSLNVATAAAMVLGEALRQMNTFGGNNID